MFVSYSVLGAFCPRVALLWHFIMRDNYQMHNLPSCLGLLEVSANIMWMSSNLGIVPSHFGLYYNLTTREGSLFSDDLTVPQPMTTINSRPSSVFAISSQEVPWNIGTQHLDNLYDTHTKFHSCKET